MLIDMKNHRPTELYQNHPHPISDNRNDIVAAGLAPYAILSRKFLHGLQEASANLGWLTSLKLQPQFSEKSRVCQNNQKPFKKVFVQFWLWDMSDIMALPPTQSPMRTIFSAKSGNVNTRVCFAIKHSCLSNGYSFHVVVFNYFAYLLTASKTMTFFLFFQASA